MFALKILHLTFVIFVIVVFLLIRLLPLRYPHFFSVL